VIKNYIKYYAIRKKQKGAKRDINPCAKQTTSKKEKNAKAIEDRSINNN